MTEPFAPAVALVIGLAAAIVWGLVLVRSLAAWHRGTERRASYVLMAGTAFIASCGTFASSIGFAMQRGLLPEFVPQDVMSFLASVGRGALLMGGLLILTHWPPPKEP